MVEFITVRNVGGWKDVEEDMRTMKSTTLIETNNYLRWRIQMPNNKKRKPNCHPLISIRYRPNNPKAIYKWNRHLERLNKWLDGVFSNA